MRPQIPPASAGAARFPLLAPFAVRSFRFQWPSDLLTSWGIEMEVPILGWYILSETGSVLLLTLYASLQYFGTLVAPMIGQAGDRFGHRTVLCVMRSAYAVFAILIAAMAFTGVIQPLFVLIVSGLVGMIRPSDLAMRSALVAEIMPRDKIMSAMGLSRTTSDSARIVGALTGAGLVTWLGIGPAYLAVTTFYLIGLALTLGIALRPHREWVAARPSFPYEVAEGLRYVWRTPCLLAAMALAFLVNLTAYPTTIGLLPYVAREIYHTGQGGLGALVASFAFGATCGSIVIGMIARSLRPARIMVLAAAGWHIMIGIFALMPDPVTGQIMLIVAGFVQSFSMVPLAAMLMRVSEERYRGRVMGVRMLAIYGLPAGLMASGVLIEWIGFIPTVTGYCAAGLLATLAIALYWRDAIWPLDSPGNAR